METFHISQLEAINAVMAAKTLIPKNLTAHRIEIRTDNIASMFSLNTGRGRDPILLACARELWMVAATQQLSIDLVHHPGASLVLADVLSRRHNSAHHHRLAEALVSHRNLLRAEPVELDHVITTNL